MKLKQTFMMMMDYYYKAKLNVKPIKQLLSIQFLKLVKAIILKDFLESVNIRSRTKLWQ